VDYIIGTNDPRKGFKGGFSTLRLTPPLVSVSARFGPFRPSLSASQIRLLGARPIMADLLKASEGGVLRGAKGDVLKAKREGRSVLNSYLAAW
jgi:hypothetical protein